MTIRNDTAVALALLLRVTAAHAHEGQPHIMGTVAAIDAQHIVVQTTEGKSVSVLVDTSTRYRQGDKSAAPTDVKVGDRVVVEARGADTPQTATEVRFAPGDGHHSQPGHDEHRSHP